MSTTLIVEVTVSGTITRACARTLNRSVRVTRPQFVGFSGSTSAEGTVRILENLGFAVRTVDAASIAGPDKARHTREVTRSRKAQARRAERAYVAMEGETDVDTLVLLREYAAKRVSA